MTNLRCLVFFSAEACQALLVYEDPERITSQDKHIHPKVKLEAIDQQRLMQVFGGNDINA